MRLYFTTSGLEPTTNTNQQIFDALFQSGEQFTFHNEEMLDYILSHPKVLIAQRTLSVATMERNNLSFNGGFFYLSECKRVLDSLDTHICIFLVQHGYQFYFRFLDGFEATPLLRPLLIDEFLADN